MNSKASQIRSIQRALKFRDHNVPFWTVLDVLEDQQRTSVRVQTYMQSLKDVQNYLIENQDRQSEVFANVGLLKEIQQILIVDMSLIQIQMTIGFEQCYFDSLVIDIHELLVGCQQEQQNAITRRIGQSKSFSEKQKILIVGINLSAQKDAKSSSQEPFQIVMINGQIQSVSHLIEIHKLRQLRLIYLFM
ncbi:unnamed protein product [Paramecium primaurelia]|uniref:Uncharacterized protein n=1 Tax=Paramecium primaurelia TaxID=5886 RepID=A0A8S1NE59_PARPR|nr:unnamed protein product [Paramecium primaurelia]